jgi:hypothetical protein
MKPKSKNLLYSIVSLVLFCIIIGVLVFSYFSLQRVQSLSKVSLRGTVTNANGKLLKGAGVILGDKYTQTNEAGDYVLQDIKWGWAQLRIESENYLPFQSDLYLPYGRPAYQNVRLESIDYAIVRGSLGFDADTDTIVANNPDIVFKINSLPVRLNSDYTFETDKVAVQKISIFIQLPGYEDYYKTIVLERGINNIGTIALTKKTTVKETATKSEDTEKVKSELYN